TSPPIGGCSDRGSRSGSWEGRGMSDSRRGKRRSFVPGVDGRAALESRLLLSAAKVVAEAAPTKEIHYHTADSGKVARIHDVDGEIYAVRVFGQGFVRAKPMSNG